jgi:quercetin dioxygenase-like cupin family protein
MEEVFYIISGRGYAVVEGCHYELEAGDVLFVDANIKHCTGAADEPMDFFVACGVYQTPFKNDWVEEFADE